MTTQPLSSCCKAPVKVIEIVKGAGFLICSECKKSVVNDTTPVNASAVEESSNFHNITSDNLKEDDILTLENGLVLRYIGDVDTRTNNCHLFKTIFSPFATVTWMEMTAEKISTLKVILTHASTDSTLREVLDEVGEDEIDGSKLGFENSPEIYGNQRLESKKQGINQERARIRSIINRRLSK